MSMKTFAAAAVILGALALLYFFMKRKEGFESQVVVRYYFSPNCGWCDKFNPEWSAFETQLAEDQKIKPATKIIKAEKINNDVAAVVQGVPTIHIIGKDGKLQEYVGPRTASDLMTKVLEVAGIATAATA